MVKRKLDGTMDESSVNQETCKSNVIVHSLWKIWKPAPSITGSYGLQAGKQANRQTKFGCGLKL